MTVWLRENVAEKVRVRVGAGVTVAVWDALVVGVGAGVTDALAEGVGVGACVMVTDWDGVGRVRLEDCVGVGAGLTVAERVKLSEAVGVLDGVGVAGGVMVDD